ncbi:MAG: ribbon-helix-helix domain-containing protein [Rhodobacteraceae bacterium]|nr:ribbon-helix-helix domain-containing protein [Paracoccaceae bacterium]
MCKLFVGEDPNFYESQTRSMRLDGQSTSIRLERAFWNVLDALAGAEGHSTPQFVSTLHAEVIERYGEARNFTSLLRCACLTHLARSPQSEMLPMTGRND